VALADRPQFFFASALAGVIGLSINNVVYRPLRQHRAPTHNLLVGSLVFLIASFGVFIVVQNVVQLIGGAEVLSLRTGQTQPGISVELFGARLAIVTQTQLLIVLASWLFAVLISSLVQWTKLGKAIRAVSDDPMAARVVGIDSERIIQAVFFIGSTVAGAAGILISAETNLEPSMGLNAVMKAIIASIIGGVGSIPGALVGGLLLGLIENGSAYWLQAAWKDAIAFGVLIAFLALRPSGIFGKRAETWRL
jgi:branched-chain amino acid transport system permease protein